MDIKINLRAEANRLGFTLFGITSLDPPQSFSVYRHWLNEGRHGTMAYLASERAIARRAEPSIIFPAAKSIITVGIRYPRPEGAPSLADEKGTGRVAAYAWGKDYHEIIPARLEQLVTFLRLQTGAHVDFRGYTDTGPILERDIASRAGLGWIGKNSCLINPDAGSYFLLAEIFTDFEIKPDVPFTADHCGSCQRCIDACPTGCILPNRTIDARRCISYLTIENKGNIPPELRPQIGNWVFGCDICQQVCPWNIRFASNQFDPEFAPDPDIVRPVLAMDISLNPEEFNRRFKKNPIQRAHRRGYLRNVAVALGNSKSKDAILPLQQVLEHEPEHMVRSHAAWALGQLEDEQARAALQKALTSETDCSVVEEIKTALGQAQ